MNKMPFDSSGIQIPHRWEIDIECTTFQILSVETKSSKKNYSTEALHGQSTRLCHFVSVLYFRQPKPTTNRLENDNGERKPVLATGIAINETQHHSLDVYVFCMYCTSLLFNWYPSYYANSGIFNARAKHEKHFIFHVRGRGLSRE
jgi:hypothetical protein